MCMRDIGRIKGFLKERVGETKGLSDWCYQINQILPSNRRLTKRELAFIFNRVLKNNVFTIEYRSDPIEYTFFRVSS